MTATINAFPPLHAFNSRSWFLAAIALLHLGFFWVLTSGLAIRIPLPKPPMTVVSTPDPEQPAPPPTRSVEDVEVTTVFAPKPEIPVLPPTDFVETITPTTHEAPPIDREGPGSAVPVPVIVEPRIDPRIGLSEPVYPPMEIRLQHTGTVVLSVQVLENGRVGEVRVGQSSGYPRLDESAVREARRWRLNPGMRDGVPVAMWKQIPITFRLRD